MDTELGGQRLREGQIVIALLAAANRDAAVCPAPDTFDITREPNRHVAFGSGVHYCIGSPLARLEATTALGSLLDRFPDLALAVPAEQIRWQREKALFRCVEALPVRFTPSA
jgi:cytochrome P450